MNNDLLRNKTTTAIITGGAQGLGFAIAERLANSVLSLPIGPHLAMEDAERVAEAVRKACQG